MEFGGLWTATAEKALIHPYSAKDRQHLDARAFIERGIQDLLEKKVIQPKAGPTKNAE